MPDTPRGSAATETAFDRKAREIARRLDVNEKRSAGASRRRSGSNARQASTLWRWGALAMTEQTTTPATIGGTMTTTATDKPESVDLTTDEGKLKLIVVGGSRPYLWIGDAEGGFIDTIEWAELREALKGVRGGR